jgi:hypothetical protein
MNANKLANPFLSINDLSINEVRTVRSSAPRKPMPEITFIKRTDFKPVAKKKKAVRRGS